MEDLFSLLVLGFFIWSMIGGLFGKKKPPQPRPRRRPGRPQPLPGEEAGHVEPGRTPQPAARHHEEESAAEMIPDDLWSILTGETRRPAPRPKPPAEPEWEAESSSQPRTEVEAEPVRREDPVPSWDPAPEPEWEIRPDPKPSWEPTGPASGKPDAEPEPVVVSTRSYEETLSKSRELRDAPLPTPPPLPEIQSAHARERGAARRAAGTRRQGRRPRKASPARRRALRRAMVLREVLGPPRGLE